MIRLKAMLTSGLITLVLCLAIVSLTLVMSDSPPVQAGAADQPAVAAEDNTYYLPLTDAPPQRNLAQQQFAPSVMQQ